MLTNQTIVCLAGRPYETGEPGAVHFLMREFSRSNLVLFVENAVGQPNLRVQDGVWVLTPPPKWLGPTALRLSVAGALSHLQTRASVLWIVDSASGFALAKALRARVCCLHFLEEDRAENRPQLTRKLEAKLANQVQVVFADSPRLAHSKRSLGCTVAHLPSGTDHRRLAAVFDATTQVDPALASLPRPLIGYIGPLDSRIDFRLLEQVAWGCPDGSLILMGTSDGLARERLRILETLPNVLHRLPPAPCHLPSCLKAFDVGILPMSLGVNPWVVQRANDYLAAGLPVVSTLPIVPDDGCASFYWAVGRAAFISAIELAVSEGTSNREHRSAIAARHSWAQRVEFASRMLETR